MRNTLSYLRLLMKISMRPMRENAGFAVFFALAMYCQDILLFAGWTVFFGAVGSVRGWGISQIFLLYGILFCSYGLPAIFINGIRQLGYKIADGEIEIYLTRPRNPLPQLLISRSNAGGIGDFLCGLTFLAGFSGLTVAQFLLAVACSILMAILFEAMKLMFYSLNFFITGGSRFGDYLTDALYYLTTVPQQGQGLVIKLFLFTVMPASLMVGVPVSLIRQQSLPLLLGFAVIVAVYAGLGAFVFRRGVERYKRVGPA